MNIKRILKFLKAATVPILVYFLTFSYFIASGQTETNFEPTTNFAIPQKNSTINFASPGTYKSANLENNTWTFVNLRLNSSQNLAELPLKVSAQDSNVTITSYQIFNFTLSRGVALSYLVSGKGKQSFNLSLDPKEGEWSVIFDGVFAGQNHGWQISKDNTTLIITGATGNATIFYFGFPESFEGNGEASNQSFNQKHSIIVATVIVLVTVISATLIIRKKTKNSRKPD
jgi:hypothetical protein